MLRVMWPSLLFQAIILNLMQKLKEFQETFHNWPLLEILTEDRNFWHICSYPCTPQNVASTNVLKTFLLNISALLFKVVNPCGYYASPDATESIAISLMKDKVWYNEFWTTLPQRDAGVWSLLIDDPITTHPEPQDHLCNKKLTVCRTYRQQATDVRSSLLMVYEFMLTSASLGSLFNFTFCF